MKMPQRAKIKTKTDIHITSLGVFRMASNSLMVPLLYWTLMSGLILPEHVAIARVAYSYKNDHCVTKSQYGLCKEWSECPIIKTLIESDEYSIQDVVRCGFNIREEIICCPVVKINGRIKITTAVETTTATPLFDIKLNAVDDLNSTSTTTWATTTHKPHFWQDLLSRSAMNAPIIGRKRLDKSSVIPKSAKSISGNHFQNNVEDNGNGRPILNTSLNNVEDNGNGPPVLDDIEAVGLLNIDHNNKGNSNSQNGRRPQNIKEQSDVEAEYIRQWNFDPTDKKPIFGPINTEVDGSRQVPPPLTNTQNGGRPQNIKEKSEDDYIREWNFDPTDNQPIFGPINTEVNGSSQVLPPLPSLPPPLTNNQNGGRPQNIKEKSEDDYIREWNFDPTDNQPIFGPINTEVNGSRQVPPPLPSLPLTNNQNGGRPQTTLEQSEADNIRESNFDPTDNETIFGLINTEVDGSTQVPPPPPSLPPPITPPQPPPPPSSSLTVSDTNGTKRPAVRACERIIKGLKPAYVPHVLNGSPAQLGEFPHMVAIGYTQLDDPNGRYYTFCGGSLIDTRFVLTAAHCLHIDSYIPRTVIMGLVDLTDSRAWDDAVVIRIKNQTMHADYSPSRTYNDIAVLELEEAIPDSKFIYPVCLHTDEADPNEMEKHWVTGWGIVNTSTKARSRNLMKAHLHVTPRDRCNATFVDYGLERRIKEGIMETLLCAEGKDQLTDACGGDSGGPLSLVVDEAYSNYSLVGVVSSGIGCGNTTPGLYTRVASFLDFIERIVWPNGGD